MSEKVKWSELKGWKEIPIGGNLPAKTSLEYKTGTWRTFRPEFDPSLCTHCMICVHYCPDSAIPVIISEEGVKGFRDRVYKGPVRLETNFDYCKGCGICAEECPTKAIKMVRETWED
ncbi:MAG: 4Fe-4S binding protein [Caldisericia bacterium]|nr:4Fe-4S binding protein [Caldisericia bacterium]